jgi:hypothetical protein
MLLPALRNAKTSARILVCVNNHRQMVVALRMYAVNYNDYSARHLWYTDFIGEQGTHGWSPKGPRPLNDYAPDTDIAHCPEDAGDSLYSWNHCRWDLFGNSYVVQYASGGHANVGKSTCVGPTPASIRLKNFKEPQFKVAFYSSNWNNNRPWYHPKTRWHKQLDKAYIPTSFIDGHAKNFFIWWRHTDTPPHGKNLPRDGYY